MSRIDVKVVLLGKEYGGKTSLVERYVNSRFIEKSKNTYQATIGAAYSSRKIEIDGNQVILGIWDTAGSEKYEAMTKIYYRNAKAAIICFDLSDMQSFEKVKFWVQELRNHEESCKIYLCGTKCDLVQQEPGRSSLDWKRIRDYSEALEAPFYETSSKTGQGVEDLFSCIARDHVFFKMELEDVMHKCRTSNPQSSYTLTTCPC